MGLRVRVCELHQVVAGELRAFEVTEVPWPVIVTMVDGELFAFRGLCPHSSVPLATYGVLGGREVLCRVHGYRFDLDTGRCARANALELARYPVTVEGSDVWVVLP